LGTNPQESLCVLCVLSVLCVEDLPAVVAALLLYGISMKGS